MDGAHVLLFTKKGIPGRARASSHVWWFLLDGRTRTICASLLGLYRALERPRLYIHTGRLGLPSTINRDVGI